MSVALVASVACFGDSDDRRNLRLVSKTMRTSVDKLTRVLTMRNVDDGILLEPSHTRDLFVRCTRLEQVNLVCGASAAGYNPLGLHNTFLATLANVTAIAWTLRSLDGPAFHGEIEYEMDNDGVATSTTMRGSIPALLAQLNQLHHTTVCLVSAVFSRPSY